MYSLLVRSDFGSFGSKCLIVCPFISFNPGGIHLDDNVTVNAGSWLDCIREYEGETFQSRLDIGDGTYIGNRAHIMACSHMKIGRNVITGDGVYITDNLHGYADIHRPIMPQPLVLPGPVTIEDEVWLGEGVCVMPNVTVGKHCVVGSNAVVTKSIPPYSVAVGVPAKVIRRYSAESGTWERLDA